MSEFSLYLSLGLEHILDTNGYDHILFVIALGVVYTIKQWKRVLILVTAFTIGHSITLALATFNIVSFKSEIIEFLIPVTIFLTAVFNIFNVNKQIDKKNGQTNYILAVCFGLIHGLGFSTFLKSILGSSSNIVSPLLAFNIGLEIGQIIIIAILLIIGFILLDILRVRKRDWVIVISSAVAGIALMLLIENKIW